jgi:DNA-binding GntR family transcriptional regulator
MTGRMPDDLLQVVKQGRSLRELTTNTLRDAILKMHFKPGQRLVERQLCEETGVSRTCVREAIQHLESEGLVERTGNRHLRVAAVSVDEARQIYEVRAALESMFARLFVARATAEDLAALEDALTQADKAAGQPPITDYVAALDRFFDTMLRGAGNDVARAMLRTLGARISFLRALTTQMSTPERERETVSLMRAIVEAAASRDGALMARRCSDFVRRSAGFAIGVLEAEERRRRAS